MIKAVLFDLGGTLYDYAILEPGNRESLMALAGWAGVKATPKEIVRANRNAMRRVFNAYLPRSFYLHRDLFRDTLIETLSEFGLELEEESFDRYRALLQRCHIRDLKLREGVPETLATLRARGIALGIVSNIDEDQLAYLTTAGGLPDCFDWMLSSEAAGSCKPDRGIFREALRRAGCVPDQVLFVGDTLRQDVAGANQAGMRSVLLWYRDDREPPGAEPEPRHVIRTIPAVMDLLV
jgi:putative hydrolase of the HAD superfamily